MNGKSELEKELEWARSQVDLLVYEQDQIATRLATWIAIRSRLESAVDRDRERRVISSAPASGEE